MTRPRYQAVYRPLDSNFETTIELARQSIAKALRVLATCEPPDTFLGRQHHDFIASPPRRPDRVMTSPA